MGPGYSVLSAQLRITTRVLPYCSKSGYPCYRVLTALLYFIYTDLLPNTAEQDEDVLSHHLLVAADRYNLERLKLLCEQKLCEYIDVGTVATILALAEQHHCHGLKKVCFDFLSSPANLKAVVASDGFKHLSSSCPSLMQELIGMLAN